MVLLIIFKQNDVNVQYELIFRARSHPVTHKVRNIIIVLTAVATCPAAGKDFTVKPGKQ